MYKKIIVMEANLNIKNNKLSYYSYWIIINFFTISVVDAILKINGVDLQYDKVFDIAVIILFIRIIKIEKITTIDSIIFIYMIYLLITVIINQYPFQLMITYYAIKTSWIPMLLYFLGKNKIFANNNFYERMRFPIAFSLALGIYFFIKMPSWYINIKTINLNKNTNAAGLNEIFRMSSFWPAPQFLGYSTFILITYLLFKFYITKKYKRYEVVIFLIAFLSIFLIQLRVVIFSSVISLLFFGAWGFFNRKSTSRRIFIVGLLLSFFLAIAYFYSFNDSFRNEFLLKKIESITNYSNLVSGRIEQMAGSRVVEKYPINILGYGMGRFGIAVAKYKMDDLRDGGYVKELVETGYFGLSLFFLFVIPTLLRAIKYIKIMPLEFIILVFYLVALIGANCITETFTLNIVFWFNLGRIWNPFLINKVIY